MIKIKWWYPRDFSRASVAAASLATGIFTAPVHAGFINIGNDTAGSTEGIGRFAGTIEYLSDSSTSGVLTITLTNTSEPSNGGFITGVIFNIDSPVVPRPSATLASATHPFLNAPAQNGAPFGNPFDAGAAIGGNWLGGGNPNPGVAVGQTGTFTFSVSGNGAGSLDELSFLHGPYTFNFLVRFKGFNNGASDKVPAMMVPTPSALGLLGLALGRPRRRSRSM